MAQKGGGPSPADEIRAVIDAALAEPGMPRIAWKETNVEGLRQLLEARLGPLGSVPTLRGGFGTSLFNYLYRLGEEKNTRFIIW